MLQLNDSKKGHGVTQAIIKDEYIAYNVLDKGDPILQLGVYSKHQIKEVKYCLMLGEETSDFSFIVLDEHF